MQIAGIGLDLIEVRRVAALLKRHGNAFREKVFTPQEIRYCEGRRNSAEHYAARIAAKEAVMKALGTGWARGVGWLDIEVRRGRGGKPNLALKGKAKSLAAKRRVTTLHVSITHTRRHALAWAIAEGR